jgi:hypothetical protein
MILAELGRPYSTRAAQHYVCPALLVVREEILGFFVILPPFFH